MRSRLLAALLSAAFTAASAAAPAAAGDAAAASRFFSRSRTSHFLLRYDIAFEHRTGRDGSARFERELLRSLEASRRQLDKLLGLVPRHRIVVTVHDPVRFDRAFAPLFRFPSAGFFHEQIHVRGARRVTPRLARVLAHELVHAAFAQRLPSLTLPAWLNEGVAVWFEERSHGKRRLSALERGALIGAFERGAWLPLETLSKPSFAALSPARAELAYLQSYAMIVHLVARRGERALRAWIRRLPHSLDVARSFARETGLEIAELERSLRESLDPRRAAGLRWRAPRRALVPGPPAPAGEGYLRSRRRDGGSRERPVCPAARSAQRPA